LEGRKLAGILIETASVGAERYGVIGIGINLVAPSAEGLRTAPAGLREVLADVQAPDVLAHIVPPLVRAIQRFAAQGFAPLVSAYAERDVLHGQTVQCTNGTEGIACGVDAGGALLVHTDAGIQKISSAEVSVRPAPSTP
jgi:BirA family biotin operon repressor/biotin-[acetyl-CoA-carboxylase] ligase